jgi:hypothetical protein
VHHGAIFENHPALWTIDLVAQLSGGLHSINLREIGAEWLMFNGLGREQSGFGHGFSTVFMALSAALCYHMVKHITPPVLVLTQSSYAGFHGLCTQVRAVPTRKRTSHEP